MKSISLNAWIGVVWVTGLIGITAGVPAANAADIQIPAIACVSPPVQTGSTYVAPNYYYIQPSANAGYAPNVGNSWLGNVNAGTAQIKCPVSVMNPATPTSLTLRSLILTYRNSKTGSIGVSLEEVPNDVSRMPTGTLPKSYVLVAPTKANPTSNPPINLTTPVSVDFTKNYYVVVVTLTSDWSNAASTPEFYGLVLRDYTTSSTTSTTLINSTSTSTTLKTY